MVEDMTGGRYSREDCAHLDPDLRRDAIERATGWRPIFGQADKAQSHLRNQEVGPGDLFLFFGYFRQAEQVGGAFRFVRGAPTRHVIFGWLQVGQVIAATDSVAAKIPWAAGHPHLVAPERYKNNTLYFASDHFSCIGTDASGAGTFERLVPDLILTQTDPYINCSTWQLPRWFAPAARSPLTYHGDPTRWTDCSTTSTRLQSVGRGQEFVLDVEQYPEARGWVRAIFRAAKR